VRAPEPPSRPQPLRFDEARLRSALAQLALGVSALHEARKLHRDIKPSNVLVTRDGRVTVLDFGLVAELAHEGVAQSMNVVVGTPGYMSPEQAMGYVLTPATDWYSVGVILYVAMTGVAPFDGPPAHVLMCQQRFDPVPPATIAPGIPADLDRLCLDLLRREPELRPTGRQILERLGDAPSPSRRSRPSIWPTVVAAPFVGREAYLAALRDASLATREGRAEIVLLHGGSGVGKSALVRAFLDRLQHELPNAVVLSGRCYPRESVPYKALDSLIDDLSMWLRRLPHAEASALVPRGAWALGRVFPVLEQVDAFAALSRTKGPATTRSGELARAAADLGAGVDSGAGSSRPGQVVDPHELRRRAFAALRELFDRIAERRPLVVAIDDLQWSDADSNALLAELFQGADAPQMLLLATYRVDDVHAQPLVRALVAASASSSTLEIRDLQVRELSRAEALGLASALLGPGQEARAARIVEEAGHSPFFIEALARHAGDEGAAERDGRPPGAALPEVDLAAVVRARIEALAPGARALLDSIVVAGRPVDASVARRAAGTEAQEPAMLAALFAAHLIQRSGAAEHVVESYHDRIRVGALALLSEDAKRERHGALAEALEASGRADAEELAGHFHAAGRLAEATRYAIRAAEVAEGALAFDRAARLYALALSLDPKLDAAVRVRLGDALVHAGRGAAAPRRPMRTSRPRRARARRRRSICGAAPPSSSS
jgi:energy-coupling factor transporter ATP-binding protein EcfA2